MKQKYLCPTQSVALFCIFAIALFAAQSNAQNAVISFRTGNPSGTWYPILDQNNIPLPYGCYIGIYLTGPDNEVDPPSSDSGNCGEPTNDDIRAIGNTIGNGLDHLVMGFNEPPFVPNGNLSTGNGAVGIPMAGMGTEPLVNQGDRMYLRAFNDLHYSCATHYNDLIAVDSLSQNWYAVYAPGPGVVLVHFGEAQPLNCGGGPCEPSEISFRTGDPSTTWCPILDQNEDPLTEGSYIGIYLTGPDNEVDPPSSDSLTCGEPTDDDVRATGNLIGNGLDHLVMGLDEPSYVPDGNLYSGNGVVIIPTVGTGTEPLVNIGDRMYLRAFNDSHYSTATHYNDLTIVNGASQNWYVVDTSGFFVVQVCFSEAQPLNCEEPPIPPASVSFRTGEAPYWSPILDPIGAPLADGSYIGIYLTGPDNEVDPPSSDSLTCGDPTDDDVRATGNTIGNGMDHLVMGWNEPPFVPDGNLLTGNGAIVIPPIGEGTEPLVNLGERMYLRAFNSVEPSTATHYNDLFTVNCYIRNWCIVQNSGPIVVMVCFAPALPLLCLGPPCLPQEAAGPEIASIPPNSTHYFFGDECTLWIQAGSSAANVTASLYDIEAPCLPFPEYNWMTRTFELTGTLGDSSDLFFGYSQTDYNASDFPAGGENLLRMMYYDGDPDSCNGVWVLAPSLVTDTPEGGYVQVRTNRVSLWTFCWNTLPYCLPLEEGGPEYAVIPPGQTHYFFNNECTLWITATLDTVTVTAELLNATPPCPIWYPDWYMTRTFYLEGDPGGHCTVNFAYSQSDYDILPWSYQPETEIVLAFYDSDTADCAYGWWGPTFPQSVTDTPWGGYVTASPRHFSPWTFVWYLPLSVELISFQAHPGDQLVRLEWETASETNNRGFHIERSTNGEDFFRIGWKEAAGEGATGAAYSYLDSPVNNGVTYTYRLVDEDINGNETINAMIAEATPSFLGDAVEITEYGLYQNYPNPFNPATRIVYDVLEAGRVSLKAYNVMGQKIATLVDEDQSNGRHSVIFDATGSSSGIYFYVINVNGFTDVKKMLFIQ